MSERKSPRKRTEDHYDAKYRLDDTLPIIQDELRYNWTKSPPESILRCRTIFRQCTPADIAKNCWTLLKPAVKEISDTFGVSRPEEEREMPPEAECISSNRFEFLHLNHFYRCPCLLGIMDDRYVVAATKISNIRQPFEPYRLFTLLHNQDGIQNLRYRSRYRHFTAAFTAEYSFRTDRQDRLCCVDYGLDFSVHGKYYLWAVLRVNELFLPIPERILLLPNLSDLAEKISRLNFYVRQFVQRLDAQRLHQIGMEPSFNLIKELTAGTAVPYYVIETLKTDRQLSKCTTKFDILQAIMRAYYMKNDDIIPSLIPLAKKFLN